MSSALLPHVPVGRLFGLIEAMARDARARRPLPPRPPPAPAARRAAPPRPGRAAPGLGPGGARRLRPDRAKGMRVAAATVAERKALFRDRVRGLPLIASILRRAGGGCAGIARGDPGGAAAARAAAGGRAPGGHRRQLGPLGGALRLRRRRRLLPQDRRNRGEMSMDRRRACGASASWEPPSASACTHRQPRLPHRGADQDRARAPGPRADDAGDRSPVLDAHGRGSGARPARRADRAERLPAGASEGGWLLPPVDDGLGRQEA